MSKCTPSSATTKAHTTLLPMMMSIAVDSTIATGAVATYQLTEEAMLHTLTITTVCSHFLFRGISNIF